MNMASSRSHCLFTINVEARKDGGDKVRPGYTSVTAGVTVMRRRAGRGRRAALGEPDRDWEPPARGGTTW